MRIGYCKVYRQFQVMF